MDALKRAIPLPLRSWLGRKRVVVGRKLLWIDRVTDFSVLRRITPYRAAFGWFRGECLDRYYIAQFLQSHARDIRGRVLEVAEPVYTKQFGADRVTAVDVIDADAKNAKANLIADLTNAPTIADDTYDCIICTQTLLCIYDFHAAIRTLHRILKPQSTVLCTVPGIAQLCPRGMLGAGDDYWRFTRHSIARAFGDVFGSPSVAVTTYGNVLSATAMLHGLVSQEFSREELDHHDPDYEVVIALRVTKGPNA